MSANIEQIAGELAEIKAMLAQLLAGNTPVTAAGGVIDQRRMAERSNTRLVAADEYITLTEAAELCKVNYHTLRGWVVIKKMIPSTRPSGKGRGDLRVRRSDVVRLMEGRSAAKKSGRSGREVRALD
jgi:hypothetical protein